MLTLHCLYDTVMFHQQAVQVAQDRANQASVLHSQLCAAAHRLSFVDGKATFENDVDVVEPRVAQQLEADLKLDIQSLLKQLVQQADEVEV